MSTEPANVSKAPAAAHAPIASGILVEATLNPTPRPPDRFATFTMESLEIWNTRSLHNDTDYVTLTAVVGANPPVHATKSLGDLNNGTHSVGLSIEVDIPDDDTAVAFIYMVRNSSHSENFQKDEEAVQSALSTIAKEIIKHATATATTVTVGSVVVPLFLSAVTAVTAILAATQAG
jgi:hypothetical protein